MRIWKTCTIATTALVSISAAGIFARPASPGTPLSQQDIAFVKDATELGRAEVQESSLATARATSDAVRQFADQMISEQTGNDKQLLQIAGEYNLRVPLSLNRPHAADTTKLSTLFGHEFETQYLQNQVKDHAVALKVYKREATEGENADLRDLAEQNVPTIQAHLSVAQDLLKTSQSNMYLHRKNMHHHGMRW